MGKRVVIVGGGFAGVSVAKQLANRNEFHVTLIDRRNYHLFQPLLYQVAMAGLSPSDISIPLRKLFSRVKNVEILMAEVDEVDLAGRRIHFEGRWIAYDYLVIACGAKHNYFGNSHWEEFAPGLKNIEQATEIRRRVLMAFELAEREENPAERQKYLTFAVVGGGPTGVELAGAIAEMAKTTLSKDYRKADLQNTRVVLIEGGPRLLAAFPETLSRQTQKSLEELGVDVVLNSRASDLSAKGLKIQNEFLETKTILWAAGVRPSQLSEKIPTKKDSFGRVMVQADLSILEDPNVFVLGDQASFLDGDGKTLPGIAPVALQQGAHLGKNLLREVQGKARLPFRYFDKGIMATIGRSRAVVKIGSLEFSGFLAWLTWVFIHILFLMQFKNKVFVFLHWVWAYFSFGLGARLIVHKTWRFYSGEKIPIGNDD